MNVCKNTYIHTYIYIHTPFIRYLHPTDTYVRGMQIKSNMQIRIPKSISLAAVHCQASKQIVINMHIKDIQIENI